MVGDLSSKPSWKKKHVIFPTWNRSVQKTRVFKMWFNSLPGNYFNLGPLVIRSCWTASDAVRDRALIFDPQLVFAAVSLLLCTKKIPEQELQAAEKNWVLCSALHCLIERCPNFESIAGLNFGLPEALVTRQCKWLRMYEDACYERQ